MRTFQFFAVRPIEIHFRAGEGLVVESDVGRLSCSADGKSQHVGIFVDYILFHITVEFHLHEEIVRREGNKRADCFGFNIFIQMNDISSSKVCAFLRSFDEIKEENI